VVSYLYAAYQPLCDESTGMNQPITTGRGTLRYGDAIYTDRRAEWRQFAPPRPNVYDDDDFAVVEDDALIEGSPEWRALLPDRRDLIQLQGYPEYEIDDGKPVYMPSRRLLAIIILLALLALLAYEFYGFFVDPVRIPELPPPPASLV